MMKYRVSTSIGPARQRSRWEPSQICRLSWRTQSLSWVCWGANKARKPTKWRLNLIRWRNVTSNSTTIIKNSSSTWNRTQKKSYWSSIPSNRRKTSMLLFRSTNFQSFFTTSRNLSTLEKTTFLSTRKGSLNLNKYTGNLWGKVQLRRWRQESKLHW